MLMCGKKRRKRNHILRSVDEAELAQIVVREILCWKKDERFIHIILHFALLFLSITSSAFKEISFDKKYQGENTFV